MANPFISAYAEAGLGGLAGSLAKDRNGNLIGFLGSRGRGASGTVGAGGAGDGLPSLDSGFVFYVDLNGAYLVDLDGNYLIGPA